MMFVPGLASHASVTEDAADSAPCAHSRKINVKTFTP
jgi:hypothetical protein